jgi:hypothetical protein
MIGGGQITKPEGQKLLWSEALETDFKPIPRKEFEAIRKSFVTCNSDGKGNYNVTLEATTLKEAQAVHREILKLRLR